jgi:hypothetical protein
MTIENNGYPSPPGVVQHGKSGGRVGVPALGKVVHHIQVLLQEEGAGSDPRLCFLAREPGVHGGGVLEAVQPLGMVETKEVEERAILTVLTHMSTFYARLFRIAEVKDGFVCVLPLSSVKCRKDVMGTHVRIVVTDNFVLGAWQPALKFPIIQLDQTSMMTVHLHCHITRYTKQVSESRFASKSSNKLNDGYMNC